MIQIKCADDIITYTNRLSVDLSLEDGDVLGLVGPNGIGKSTLFHFIKLNQFKLFPQNRISFMDQFPLRPLGHLRGKDMFKMLDESFPQRINSQWEQLSLINRYNFKEKLNIPINRLSGGENQILKILLLFYLDFSVAFLDEPASYLDVSRIALLKDNIRELKREKKIVIIIDHHKDFLSDCCDKFCRFENSNGSLTLKKIIEKSNLDDEFFRYC